MHRKKPFSAKQKKAQIQAKRAQKREQAEQDDPEWDFGAGPGPRGSQAEADKPRGDPGRNKLTSQFDKLTRPEIEANKKRSMQPLERRAAEQCLVMSFDEAYSADVDIPVRPEWRRSESKEAVEAREEAYFAQWLARIQELRDQDSVSLYEKNLEVWRQLWRVVEISDVLLLIVDIRHPVLHFPPSLYRYVVETAGKPLVVVLNKTDLVAPATVAAWTAYFRERFPAVQLATFCCYRGAVAAVDEDSSVAAMKQRRRRPRRRVYESAQVGRLLAACRDVCEPGKRAVVDWDEIIARYAGPDGEPPSGEPPAESDDESGDESDAESVAAADGHAAGDAEPAGGARHVTIGLVGHPNVGKSTVINSIARRSVVSTSRTPGHTKHFQTIHVAPTLRLCDCPGLVFPCVVERPLQVLAGLYNIAQVQEPYTAVQYLAERVPVEQVLALRPPPDARGPAAAYRWSAWDICEAFAVDRGFFTPKAARPDVYRAALYMLRWVLDGRVLLSFKPPGFFAAGGGARPASHLPTAAEERRPADAGSDASGSEDGGGGAPIARQSAFALLGEESC
ncbi:hypothetical protein IWQ56_000348 [Coemansia nantahalensis]|nr:hypothetical protein IWQ56_000348 [Coemansia nantahalensis]